MVAARATRRIDLIEDVSRYFSVRTGQRRRGGTGINADLCRGVGNVDLTGRELIVDGDCANLILQEFDGCGGRVSVDGMDDGVVRCA